MPGDKPLPLDFVKVPLDARRPTSDRGMKSSSSSSGGQRGVTSTRSSTGTGMSIRTTLGESAQHSIDERYTMGKVLGRGGFGEVRHATRKSDGKEVGIKIISKLKFAGDEEHQFMLTEVQMHEKVRGHQNVTELYESTEDKGSFYMVLE